MPKGVPRSSIKGGSASVLNDIPTMISPARRAELDKAAKARARTAAPRKPRETKAQKAARDQAAARRMPVVRRSTVPAIVRRQEEASYPLQESTLLEGDYIPAERPVVPSATPQGQTIEGSLPANAGRSSVPMAEVLNAAPVRVEGETPTNDQAVGPARNPFNTYEGEFTDVPDPAMATAGAGGGGGMGATPAASGTASGGGSSQQRASGKSPLSTLTQIGRIVIKLLSSINKTLLSMAGQSTANTKAQALASRRAQLKTTTKDGKEKEEKKSGNSESWLGTIVQFLLPALALLIKPVIEGIKTVSNWIENLYNWFTGKSSSGSEGSTGGFRNPLADIGRYVGDKVFNGLNPELAARVMHAESGGNPNAISSKGARGLMQIIPSTAMRPGYGISSIFDVADSMNVPYSGRNEAESKRLLMIPEVNTRFGNDYLNTMLKRYKGNEADALVAYNWGPDNADKWVAAGRPMESLKDLPRETRNYVQKILGRPANSPQQRVAQQQRPRATPVVPASMLENRAMPTQQVPVVVAPVVTGEAQMAPASAPNVTNVPPVAYVPSVSPDSSYDWLQYHSYA